MLTISYLEVSILFSCGHSWFLIYKSISQEIIVQRNGIEQASLMIKCFFIYFPPFYLLDWIGKLIMGACLS